MQEMTRIPILSPAPAPASVTPASSAPASPLGTANATPPVVSAENAYSASSQGSAASAPAGNPADSFASILKRQLAQSVTSTTSTQPLVSELAAPALASKLVANPTDVLPPVNVVMASELIAWPPTDPATTPAPALVAVQPLNVVMTSELIAWPPTDPATTPAPALVAVQPLNAVLASDLTVKPQESVAQIPDLNAEPAADTGPLAELNAGQLLNLNPAPKLSTTPAEDTASTSAHPANQDDAVTPQEVPGNGLAALLAFFPPLVPNDSAKPDTALPTTEKRSSAGSASTQMLTIATAAMVQSNPTGKEGKTPPNLAEASPSTTSKAADFAAAQALSADVVPAHASRIELPGSETSFENMLVAAQLSNQGRSAETHLQASHTAAPITVQTPVSAHGWDGEVGEKLVWMVGRQEQRAELVLNPPQLGRVEVTLTISGDQTNASFVSANPTVRDALETAMPRLREMLADAGINLGQAQVGADSGNNAANQSANNRENGDNSSRFSNKSDVALGASILRQTGNSQWLRQGSSLVDIFA